MRYKTLKLVEKVNAEFLDRLEQNRFTDLPYFASHLDELEEVINNCSNPRKKAEYKKLLRTARIFATGKYKESSLNEDIDTGEDLENDTVNDVVDEIQDDTTAEAEEVDNKLDTQLEDLREVLPDLDLNLYQVISKEDPNKIFYFIGKVAEDSDDLLMLIDNNPQDEEGEPSKIDNELPEDTDNKDFDFSKEQVDSIKQEIEQQEDGEIEEDTRFDFVKVPNNYEDFATLNPRYGDDISQDHSAIMEYLMKCLVKTSPERADELANEDVLRGEDVETEDDEYDERREDFNEI